MIEKKVVGRGSKMWYTAFPRWFCMLWPCCLCSDDDKVDKMGPRVHNERRWIFKIVRFTSIKRLFFHFCIITYLKHSRYKCNTKIAAKVLRGGLRGHPDRTRTAPRGAQRAAQKNWNRSKMAPRRDKSENWRTLLGPLLVQEGSGLVPSNIFSHWMWKNMGFHFWTIFGHFLHHFWPFLDHFWTVFKKRFFMLHW